MKIKSTLRKLSTFNFPTRLRLRANSLAGGHFSIQKGFTLIELLIVIAILGILAAGVLVAINPVQKINQTKDANAKSDVGQIATALQAYYTTNSAYPTTAQGLNELVTSKELKVLPTSAITYTVVSGEVSLRYTLLAPAVAANGFWCWRSVTGVTAAVSVCVP